MKGSIWKAVGIVTALCLLSVTAVAAGGADLAAVRQVTSRFHRVEVAQAAGYSLLPGCFAEPGVGAMGYHYVDFNSVDLTIDALHPEAMVYAPGPQGQLQLGAVEYIVPAALWDAAHSQPPSLFGHQFLVDDDFGTYELHVWLWQSNPLGMFEPLESASDVSLTTARCVWPRESPRASTSTPVGSLPDRRQWKRYLTAR